MKNILDNKKEMVLLGNEAVVRGALESGVQFVSTYPGTPASEIGDIFHVIAKQAGVYFEFSTNEKVAMEAGAGASFSGLKTLVAMKNFGLNVASDFFLPLVYSGIKGPMVLLVADDPSCWSSAQTEENTRPNWDIEYYNLWHDLQDRAMALEIQKKPFKIVIEYTNNTKEAIHNF